MAGGKRRFSSAFHRRRYRFNAPERYGRGKTVSLNIKKGRIMVSTRLSAMAGGKHNSLMVPSRIWAEVSTRLSAMAGGKHKVPANQKFKKPLGFNAPERYGRGKTDRGRGPPARKVRCFNAPERYGRGKTHHICDDSSGCMGVSTRLSAMAGGKPTALLLLR